VLPRGKQSADWVDDDTIIVAREWAAGELTTSGYPYIVKRVRRGDPLTNAVEVYRAAASDVAATPFVLRDSQGHRAVFIDREISTFTFEHYLLTPYGPHKLNMPLKTTVSALIADRLLITLAEDWNVDGATFPRGSLVAVDLEAATSDPSHLRPTLIYKPGSRESLDKAVVTRSFVIVTTYENVRGRAFVYTPTPHGAWTKRRLDLPDLASIVVVDANLHNDNAFLLVTSFLTPSTLWRADVSSGSRAIVKALPPKFDASRDVVDQREATSRDGTRVWRRGSPTVKRWLPLTGVRGERRHGALAVLPRGAEGDLDPEAVVGDAEGGILYTSDAADDLPCVDLGGRRIIKNRRC